MDDTRHITPMPTVSGDWPAFPPNLRFIKKIGQGGIAKVYKAVQEPLNREVAVKLLTLQTQEHVARFEREARLMSTFQHENITHVYDFYRDASRLYMVMELVEGVDIKELLQDGKPFPPEIAAAIALKTARALEYIHNRKTVHRDIKPGNIMLAYDGNVKLMDFGIARHYGERLTNDSDAAVPHDEDGMGIGTPAYISPEQLRGEPVDGRSDIYSLGVVFYRMLTGVKPFVYRTENTLFSKIQHNTPVPPRSLMPDIPRVLDRIIMRCLEKSPQDRYRDASELMQDLERYLKRSNPFLKFEFVFIEFLQSKQQLTRSHTDTMMANLALSHLERKRRHPVNWWPIIAILMAAGLLTQTILLWLGII
ncbi:serine/threonine protein kinase [Myxococcota bacterium]|nr:serine/threonine protein kinase [Myxococcota bacterium]